MVAFALQLALSLVLAGAGFYRLAPLMFELHAVAGLVATAGHPKAMRRRGAMLGGLLAAVLAGVFLGRAPAQNPLRKELVSQDMGYRLVLPEGYDQVTREQLAPHLSIPRAAAGSSVAFAGSASFGVLTVERDRSIQLIGGCQSYLESLGATNSPRPVEGTVPAALGEVALVYEVRSPAGDVGRLGCGKLDDGRFVALAVVTAPDRGQTAQARVRPGRPGVDHQVGPKGAAADADEGCSSTTAASTAPRAPRCSRASTRTRSTRARS